MEILYCRKLRQDLWDGLLGNALASWAKQHGIRFIDPLPRFRQLEAAGQRLYFELDAHWTAAGHAAAGDLITEYLRFDEDIFGGVTNDFLCPVQ